ncbi:MAG: tetratricopeptide repeat protein [Planctomycetes bacterium]|nr:tetratricopeptide repeat protein [Planctomycetota bacterium]
MTLFNCPKCNKQYSFADSRGVAQTCPACDSVLQSVQGQSVSSSRFSSSADIPEEVKEGMKTVNLTIAGKYILAQKIGQGGMGAVYKAWDTSLKRYVAVKIILPSLIDPSSQDASAGEVIERFISEAQTAAKLIHPNILQVYETGVQDDTYYIIMEYVNGGSLNEYWAQRQRAAGSAGAQNEDDYKLPSRENISEYAVLMKDVVKAIDHAHNYNIIHRDIKPANILLLRGQHGEIIPKISDFGLAKEVTSDKNITVAGTIMGTPAYMSPEQSLAFALDNKSDIFSLGSVLYRLCTGSDPFFGASYLDVIKAVAVKEPIPPRRVNGAIDRDLEIIILKAMEKEKERRYASAAEFAEDIERYLRNEPIIARPASMAYKVSKNIKRNKIAFIGIAVAALVIAVVVTGLLLSWYNMHKSAEAYLVRGDELFSAQNWKEARDYYIKCSELIKNDPAIKEKIENCARKIEDEKKAEEDAQTAWLYAVQVFQEFYKNNANMNKVWKHIDDSIAMLDKSINLYPTPKGYFFRAMLYKEKGRIEDAERDLSMAIALKPDYNLAYIIRGTVYFEKYITTQSKDMEQKAAKDFASIKSLEGIPEQFLSYKIIFEDIMVFRQDNEKGLALLKEGFEKNNNEEFLVWYTVFSLKRLAFDKDKGAKEAEECIDMAIAMKPQYAKSYLLRSMIRNFHKDYDGAIADLTAAIRINPENAPAYRDRGSNRSMKGDSDGAIEDYGEAIKIDPLSAAAYLLRANEKDARGDSAGALADINAVLKFNPDSEDALVSSSVMKSKMGDDNGAIADLNRAIRANPYSATAYYNLSLLFLNRGEIKKSISLATEAIRLNRDFADAYNHRGYVRNADGDEKGAIEDYTKAIQINPSFIEAYRRRAIVLNTMGEPGKAVQDFSKAMELDPGEPNDYYKRALAKAKAGEFAGAIEDFSACVQRLPDYEPAYRGRGNARYEIKDLDGAIEDFTKAIQLNANSSYYYTRGLIKSDKGDVDGALEDYNKAIQMDPDGATLFLARVIARLAKGDKAGAAEDLSMALQKKPQLIDSVNGSILTYMQEDKWEDAVKWLDLLIEATTDNQPAYKYRGHARYMLGDIDGAVEDVSAAIRLNPSDANAYYECAKLKSRKGDLDGAISDFTEVIRIEPFNATAYFDRGTVWYNKGDMEQAISDYSLSIRISPGDSVSYMYRGDAFIKKGDMDKAGEDYEKSISLDPGNASGWFSCGVVKYEKGDYDGAIDDYSKAIRLNPEYAQAYTNRGVNYCKKERYAEAISDMEKALKLDPEMAEFLAPYLEEAKKKIGQ